MLSVKLPGVSDRAFVLKVIFQIRNFIQFAYDSKKLTNIENYINECEQFKSIYRKHYSCKDILYYSSYNIVYDIYDSGVVIFIDPNVYFPGTQVKLCQLCQLIDSGAMGLSGTYIYTNIFTQVKNSLYDWEELYKIGVF